MHDEAGRLWRERQIGNLPGLAEVGQRSLGLRLAGEAHGETFRPSSIAGVQL